MLFYNSVQKFAMLVTAAVNDIVKWDYTLGTFAAIAGTFDDVTYPGICIVTTAAGDVNDGSGPQIYIARDAGGNAVGVVNEHVIPGVLPSLNDVSAVNALVQPAAIRAAIGLALANLDAQLAALSTLSPAAVRTAIGMASANLDSQLASILGTQSGPVTLSPTGVQQVVVAVGTGIPSVPVPLSPSSFPYHNSAL